MEQRWAVPQRWHRNSPGPGRRADKLQKRRLARVMARVVLSVAVLGFSDALASADSLEYPSPDPHRPGRPEPALALRTSSSPLRPDAYRTGQEARFRCPYRQGRAAQTRQHGIRNGRSGWRFRTPHRASPDGLPARLRIAADGRARPAAERDQRFYQSGAATEPMTRLFGSRM